MNILLIGGNSFLGKEISKIAKSQKFLTVWTVNRCKSSDCLHDSFTLTICVDESGKILSKNCANFECTYLLSTYYSKNEEDEDKIVECNIHFLGKMIDTFKDFTKKFVYTNSYLALPNKKRVKTSTYAESKKILGETLKEKLKTTNIYYDNVFTYDVIGPDDVRKKFLDLAVKNQAVNMPLPASNGDQIICPIHVRDAAISLLSLYNLKSNAQWQLKGPEPLSLKKYVERYEILFKTELNIKWGSFEYYGDEIFEIESILPDLCVKYTFGSIEDILLDIYSAH
jgi:nucleoside-diphosphate-sugar epimerase